MLKLSPSNDRAGWYHMGADRHGPCYTPYESALWLISNAATLPPEVVNFSQRQGLTIQRLGPQDGLETMLGGGLPAAVAWDMTGAVSGDWQVIRRLHNHPQLNQAPFILYQQEAAGEAVSGASGTDHRYGLMVKTAPLNRNV